MYHQGNQSVFVGGRLWTLLPPPAYMARKLLNKTQNKQKEVLHLCRWSTHTHTGPRRAPKESWREEMHRSFYTQGLLHREAFTQRSFLRTEGFTQRSLYSKELLHTNVLELLNTKSVTQRSLYTEGLNTQTRLHTETCTQRSLYSGSFYTRKRKLLHREIFTQTRFQTEKLSHTEGSFYTKKSLHRELFTKKNFYTQKLLHREVFAQRRLHTK